MYGIVTKGMDGEDSNSFVKSYQLKTSEKSDCDQLVTHGGSSRVRVNYIINTDLKVLKMKGLNVF